MGDDYRREFHIKRREFLKGILGSSLALSSGNPFPDLQFLNPPGAFKNIDTGFEEIDSLISLTPGELIVVGDRTRTCNIGRTFFPLYVSMHVAAVFQQPVAYFSVVEREINVRQKMFILKNTLWDNERLPLMIINDKSTITLQEISNRANKLTVNHGGLGLITVADIHNVNRR